MASTGQPARGTLLLLAALAFTSCSKPADPLPGGYFIAQPSSREMFLGEPKYNGNIPELGTDLQEVGSHEHFIFGRYGPGRGTKGGFFLLDTRDGSLQHGLSQSNWITLTTAAGIPNPPPLVHPTRKSPLRR